MDLNNTIARTLTEWNLPSHVLNTVRRTNERLDDAGITPGIAIGDNAPLFCLNSTTGEAVCLDQRLRQGPVVISFFRGAWCPFCTLEFEALQASFEMIKTLGGSLLAVGPQSADQLTELHELGIEYDVLCDIDQKVIVAYQLQFEVPEALREIYQDVFGVDVREKNSDHSWRLPVPATFVIDAQGIVCARFVSQDYAKRMEPKHIVTTLRALTEEKQVLLSELQAKNVMLQNTVTELRQTQSKLIRQEKKAVVGTLTAGLSHEIKNLLNPISFLEVIDMEVAEHDKKYIGFIFDSRDRILNLINEVRVLAKDEEAQFMTSDLNLTELIEESVILAKMDSAVQSHNIHLICDFSGDVMVNKNKIIQVLMNLMRNAAHAVVGKQNAKITVKTRQQDDKAMIQVIDNGSGIDESKLESIWKPFFTTKGDEGTGLGLDICKNIIEQHQGSIVCESQVNKGTTFAFTLPVA